MKWRGRERSSNIEDRRGAGPGGGLGRMGGNPLGTGGGIRLPTGGRSGGGMGGMLGVIVVLGILYFVNPGLLDGLIGGGSTVPAGSSSQSRPLPQAGRDDLADFVGVVVKETETVWTDIFAQNNLRYEPPTVVLFTGQTQSGCGPADSRMGPFYCPADRKVYIDLSFYDELRSKFGAPGDFAQAYVLAHEVGHHVQQLTGVLPEFNQVRARLSEEEANRRSVRIELQADCYAGIWAHAVGQQNLLENGDIEEAINAAEAIGDDTLQKRMQGFAVPKTFSHGTSQQRMTWFRRGYESGDVGRCDTSTGNI